MFCRSPRIAEGRSPRLTWSGEPVTIGSSGIERMPMTGHDDSQRSGRLAMTFGDLRVVDRFPAACDGSPLGVGWMSMMRHDDSQRSDRLAVTQLSAGSLTHSLTHSLASRPANRATAVRSAPVLSAAPSIGVAHSRHASARLAADRVGRSLHQSTERALPATQLRVSSSPPSSIHHRRACFGLPTTRPAAPSARTPVNASPSLLRAAAHDSAPPPWAASPSTYDSSIHHTLPVFAGAQEARMILKEP